MDLITDLISEKPIYSFLKKFPEKDWNGIIKKTLMYGIQTFEVLNNLGLISYVSVLKEREKLADIENLNIHERRTSQPTMATDENQPEDSKIKKQITKLRVSKPASTPRSLKMTPKAQNVTSPVRKMTFDPPLTSRNSARIKKIRNSSESKSKILIKKTSKKVSPSKEKLILKKMTTFVDKEENIDLGSKQRDSTPSNSSTMSNAQYVERDSFGQCGNETKEEKQIISIELNIDKKSKSALIYTTSSSEDDI